MYTKAELREFDVLTTMTSSQDNFTRIKGRLRLRPFIEKHGQAKCDEMFDVLMKKGTR